MKRKSTDTISASQAKSPKPPAPPYGSHEYWENRYKSHRHYHEQAINHKPNDDEKQDHINQGLKNNDCTTATPGKYIDGEEKQSMGKSAPSPSAKMIAEPEHAWYFSFDELAPLLLPLLMRSDEKGSEKKKLSFLEVGCGDVPLGNDLVKDESIILSKILSRVVCFDYSEIVIEMLKKRQSLQKDDDSVGKDSSKIEKLKVEYVVADARNLPYKNDTFDVIVDKGTIDAMLSDNKVGIQNCISIVSEAARLLSPNGAIMIISHLNPNNSSGLSWLDEVVVAGLRKGGGNKTWVVEAHGNDPDEDDFVIEEEEEDSEDETEVDSPDECENENEGKDNSKDGNNDDNQSKASNNEDDNNEKEMGPTVYIIKNTGTFVTKDNTDSDEPPTIPLEFFSY